MHTAAMPHLAVIGLGANLGNPLDTLNRAIAHLQANNATSDWQVSPRYRTAPIGSDEAQPDYINAVASCRTTLAAEDFMRWLQDAERLFGRDRSQDVSRNAARTLDLDLLLFDTLTMASSLLVLPHPRLHQRAFVLRPLLDILPDAVAPGLGRLDQYLPQVVEQAIDRLD